MLFPRVSHFCCRCDPSNVFITRAYSRAHDANIFKNANETDVHTVQRSNKSKRHKTRFSVGAVQLFYPRDSFGVVKNALNWVTVQHQTTRQHYRFCEVFPFRFLVHESIDSNFTTRLLGSTSYISNSLCTNTVTSNQVYLNHAPTQNSQLI